VFISNLEKEEKETKGKRRKVNMPAAHNLAATMASKASPSVVKEICYGFTLGLFAGGLWKMHHWSEQRKTREFYDLLERGEISVVVPEE